MDNLIIEFRGMLFEGLRFKGSNKYSDEYFDKLLESDNHYNRIKYKDVVTEQVDEQIHIKLSSSFVSVIFSYFCMFISIVMVLNHNFILSISILVAGFISHLFSKYFTKRANEIFSGKQMCRDLVDVVYEMKL